MANAAYVQAIETEIRKSKSRLRKHRDLEWNEYQTRYYLIDPILRALGWDINDPGKVLIEDSQTNNQRPDYKLLDSNSEDPIVVVEAKRISHGDIEYIFGPQDPEEDPNAAWIEWGDDEVEQLRGYTEEMVSGYGVLTDGNAWAVWDLSRGKPGDCNPAPYVWAFCDNAKCVSESLKILHRRNVGNMG